MDATNSSSCSELAEHATTALFHARLRALYRRRLVLARTALVAQLELLQFDLRELESAVKQHAPGPNLDAQLTECTSGPSVERNSAELGTSILVTDDIFKEQCQLLCCRVRESASKVLSLASELRSTLCASEQDIDADSAADIQKLLGQAFKAVQSCRLINTSTDSFRSHSVAGLDAGPLEPLVAVDPKALSLELNELGSGKLGPSIAIQREEKEDIQNGTQLEVGSVAKSFFAEELRLLRFPASGAISFQGSCVLQSLRLSQLYRTQKTKLIIPQSYHSRNFSENDLGFSSLTESASDIANISGEAALSANAADSHNFTIPTDAGHVRSHFFQRRTYYNKQGRFADELRAATAPWCSDLDGPSGSFGLAGLTPGKSSPELRSGHVDSGTVKRECRIAARAARAACADPAPVSGCGYDSFRGNVSGTANASEYSDLSPLSGYGYNGYRIDAAPSVRATSASDPPSGYGYNGFRVDAAIPAPVITNPNFQKRTIFPSQTPNLGFVFYDYNNPDLVGMSPPATPRDDHPSVTNPLAFLLSNSSFAGGPYFTTATGSSPVVLFPDDEVCEANEVFCINRDGSLSKSG